VGADDASDERVEAAPPPPPRTWRWVSTSRTGVEVDTAEATPAVADPDVPMADATAPAAAASERTMHIVFGVPLVALGGGGVEGTPVGAFDPAERAKAEQARCAAARGAVCAVSGCERARKYRLVRDFARGACGVEHLKVLEAA
jgi:Ino eighty subunit 2